MKSKIREVIYLATDLNQTLRELIQAIGELEIEVDHKLKQEKELGDIQKWIITKINQKD